MTINKNKIINVFNALFWALMAAACLTLLVSAVQKKDAGRCTGTVIGISGVSNNYFIDRSDVYAIIRKHGGDSTLKSSMSAVDLKRIEKILEKDVWIKNAELYFDNANCLKVFVEEREPIARVFTVTGNTFYIDSSCKMLPLSDKFSARLPVFTGFTSDAAVLSKVDSNLLMAVKNISLKILADSFLTAMIDQVDITATRSFEMTPKMGKQVIIFGDAGDADAKFSKLKKFYKEVIPRAGWNRYKTINLQFKNQVVGVIRGKEDIVADSLRTLELMKFIAEDAARRASDSTRSFVQDSDRNTADSTMIGRSFQRDEEGGASSAPGPVTLPVPATSVPAAVNLPKPRPPAAAIKKRVLKKPQKMPVKKTINDY
ncbi:MAG: FtsQ-type POTRA domain-containing protein [Ferruginibacter sp.]